jgi:hypothetical protein
VTATVGDFVTLPKPCVAGSNPAGGTPPELRLLTGPTSSVDPIKTGGHRILCLQARPLTWAFVTRQRVDVGSDGSSPTRILLSAGPSSPSAALWSTTTSASPGAATAGVGWNHDAGGGRGERACGRRHARVRRRSRAGRGRRVARRTLHTAEANSRPLSHMCHPRAPDRVRGSRSQRERPRWPWCGDTRPKVRVRARPSGDLAAPTPWLIIAWRTVPASSRSLALPPGGSPGNALIQSGSPQTCVRCCPRSPILGLAIAASAVPSVRGDGRWGRPRWARRGTRRHRRSAPAPDRWSRCGARRRGRGWNR